MKGNSSSSSTSKKLAKPLPPPRSRNPPSKASEQRSLCSELEDVACLSMRELVAQKIKGNPSLAELDLSWSLTASFERIKVPSPLSPRKSKESRSSAASGCSSSPATALNESRASSAPHSHPLISIWLTTASPRLKTCSSSLVTKN